MAPKRFIDLSISIEPELPSDPPMMIPKIDYINHESGAEQMKAFYPGVRKEQLPGGLGWAVEFLCHMEKMANLSAIGRPHGFQVSCFPVKIKGASAGWIRPVAIIEE